MEPTLRPRYRLSAACAASSRTGSPSSSSGSRSAGWPARSTGRITFVRSVIASATRAGSMFRSPSRTSTKIGVAPQCTITFAVAGHVIGEVITSSPASTPSATSDRCSAAVPDASASTCFASRYSAIRRSSSAARGPVVSQPERSVSATAATSSSPTAGGWKPSMVSRLDESFDIHRLESNRRLGTVGTFERFPTRIPHREHRAGSIRPAPELLEAVPPAPVDPNAADPLLRVRLLDPRDLTELAGRRHEEPDTRGAHMSQRAPAHSPESPLRAPPPMLHR